MTSSIDKLYNDVINHKININDDYDYDSMKIKIYKLRKIANIFENMCKNYKIKNNKKEGKPNGICYICNVPTPPNHDFYKKMCHRCGLLNKIKRDSFVNQKNKIAIVTGGRVKIGFETSLRLLRCECYVIITTRFAKDALERYLKEPDYEKWIDNLKIFEADFLSLQDTKDFIDFINEKYDKIDYLINNAAQTIDRPNDFYNHLLLANPEMKFIENNIINPYHKNLIENNLENKNKTLENNNSKDKDKILENKNEIIMKTEYYNCDDKIIFEQNTELFPLNKYDKFGQQIDLRKKNSWILEIDDIEINEFLKIQAINNFTPFMLVNKLIPLLKRENEQYTYVINVTSMEGIFNWKNKSSRHVHTNMAKASLNMMTRTCSNYLKDKHNIIMCAVETGWNNPQFPLSYDYETPLDCLDGAMRILEPIFCQLKDSGVIYKDYQIYDW